MEVLFIADAARLLGISVARLRDAERRGEIPRPAGKTSFGWHIYTEADMEVLRQWRAAVAARAQAHAAARARKGAAAQAA